jgi:hypothetical protein
MIGTSQKRDSADANHRHRLSTLDLQEQTRHGNCRLVEFIKKDERAFQFREAFMQESGRNLVLCSIGTLQSLTRCSSVHFSLSRSLPVRVLATPDRAEAPSSFGSGVRSSAEDTVAAMTTTSKSVTLEQCLKNIRFMYLPS